MISVSDGKITIQREDRNEFTVDISTFSGQDAKYVEEWLAVQSAPKPEVEALMATTGKLIFSDAFASVGGEWKGAKGEWKAEEGALS